MQLTQETKDLIVATLHPFGTCNRLLSEEALDRVFAEADGYGRKTIQELRELGIDRDWSHIRDSSDEAKVRVAAAIRSELIKLDMERTRKFPELESDSMETTAFRVMAMLGGPTKAR
jgi:hypothetical protein